MYDTGYDLGLATIGQTLLGGGGNYWRPDCAETGVCPNEDALKQAEQRLSERGL